MVQHLLSIYQRIRGEKESVKYRNMSKKHVGIFISGFVLLLASACKDNFRDLRIDTQDSDLITFAAQQSSSTLRSDAGGDSIPRTSAFILDTDGGMISGVDYHFIVEQRETTESDLQSEVLRAEGKGKSYKPKSFSVIAAKYVVGESFGAQTPINFMMPAINVTQGDGSCFRPSTTYRWPGESFNLSFFAVEPAGALSLEGTKGFPTLQYTTPTETSAQTDIMVAQALNIAGDGGADKHVPLEFKHILSQIKFKAGEDFPESTIKTITLKGIKYKGTYTYDNSGVGSWTNDSETKGFTVTVDKTLALDRTEAVDLLTDDNNVFMMLPQTFTGASSSIEVVYRVERESDDRTLTASLAGKWEPGKTIIYTLTGVNNTLDVTTSKEAIPVDGGNFSINLKSYYLTNAASTAPKAVPWHTEVRIDGGDWSTDIPDYIEGLPNSGVGGEQKIDINVTEPADITFPGGLNQPNRTLRGTQAKTETVDLSMETGTRTTANCYVINAAGTYSFPLVYGNAVVNGTPNPGAYTPIGDLPQNSFVDHKGTPINNPYIYTNHTPAKAKLLWEDFPGLIKNVRLSDDKHSIIFTTADKDHIAQGNAVIAVKDAGGTIMWSWHIWVTDMKLTDTYTVTTKWSNTDPDQDMEFKFLRDLIGYCEKQDYEFKRTIEIRFVQEKSSIVPKPKKAETTITQQEEPTNDSYSESSNNAPYYQWGRKDPMIPSIYKPNSPTEDYEKRVYPMGVTMESMKGKKKLEIGIQNPTFFIGGTNYNDNPGLLVNANSWNANRHIKKGDQLMLGDGSMGVPKYENPRKTVYDPSPVGFCVPTDQAMSNLASVPVGEQTSNINQINTSDDLAQIVANQSITMYCNRIKKNGQKDLTGKTFTLPILGLVWQNKREYSGWADGDVFAGKMGDTFITWTERISLLKKGKSNPTYTFNLFISITNGKKTITLRNFYKKYPIMIRDACAMRAMEDKEPLGPNRDGLPKQ